MTLNLRWRLRERTLGNTDPILNGTLPFPLFPSNHWWYQNISSAPVDSNSATWISNFSTIIPKFDFGGVVDSGTLEKNPGGAVPPNVMLGISWATVSGSQPKLPLYAIYWTETDGGFEPDVDEPIDFYPIPEEMKTQSLWFQPGQPGTYSSADVGTDRHAIIVDRDNHHLYEIYNLWWTNRSGTWRWEAHDDGEGGGGSGAFWDLTTRDQRPAGWTAATAAGTQVIGGLYTYDEVYGADASLINHCHSVTVTVANRDTYGWPATKLDYAGASGYIPYGARLRLKSSVDVSGWSTAKQRILNSMKTYGLIVNDRGGSLFLPGQFDERWNATGGVWSPSVLGGPWLYNELVGEPQVDIRGSDFEVIQLGWGEY